MFEICTLPLNLSFLSQNKTISNSISQCFNIHKFQVVFSNKLKFFRRYNGKSKDILKILEHFWMKDTFQYEYCGTKY